MRHIARNIIKTLNAKRLQLASAESCTGGMVADTLTDIPGASRRYIGGVVVYTGKAKTRLLSLPNRMIADFSEVSVYTTHALAERIKELLQADISIAVTGYLGPAGGTKKIPRGTVYIVGMSDKITICRVLHLRGSRLQNKRQTAITALLVIKRILAHYR